MGFHEIEQAGKKMFEQFPVIKRSAKRVYQLASVATSKEKFKSEGDVVRVSPDDGYEYFYGYYDKSPWDATDRYMIAIKVKQAYKSVAPKEPGTVGVIDTQDNNKYIEIGTTHSWNVQQSCMAQWMGPDFETRILYNDCRDGKYCSVIYNFKERKEEKVLPMALYDVARDGSFGLSLDFSRLHRMRPGYGYSNLSEKTKGVLCPDTTCIWKVDIATGKVEELFKYTDMAAFESDESMIGAEHKVNHLMISPNGKRFMVLHRWFQKGRKHTRLVTVNVDKTEMYNLSDDVFVSHCYWKNDNEILSFLRKKETGDHYYLMKDKTQEYKMYWPELNTDGHCSYSPDGRFIITDTYPNRKRIASVYLCTEADNRSRRIARVFSPFKYDNDCRCDLHPRWNRKGDRVCIDSVHEGKRGIYTISILESQKDLFYKTNERKDVLIVRSNKFQLINKNYQSRLFTVDDMFDNLGGFSKIKRDIFLYSHKKVPEKYYNQKLKSIEEDTVIVFDPHCRVDFLRWIKKNNPNKRIILWLWNTVKEIGSNLPLDEIPKGIEIWSYSQFDCKTYGLKYNTTFYPYPVPVNTEAPNIYDVFFIGKDKGRLNEIMRIKNVLENNGLKTHFHISPTHQYEKFLNQNYKSKISYDEVKRLIMSSACILDCEVSSTAGPTIRPLEALFYKKKLITNNKSVINEVYYNHENIFIYGIDDNSKIEEFVRTPYDHSADKFIYQYTFDSWVERFM